ncbi:hypothetical protein CYY_001561 [Polysphondylium violaceum]|uniref:DH domain-containing protein n=1 Tax=Polysphondylium violaceum TaxID=133409 RepID=A0A8J4VAG5_9MYCE|nr:hypothetical protein CYY_001561 [Polysphondylium violaceum]
MGPKKNRKKNNNSPNSNGKLTVSEEHQDSAATIDIRKSCDEVTLTPIATINDGADVVVNTTTDIKEDEITTAAGTTSSGNDNSHPDESSVSQLSDTIETIHIKEEQQSDKPKEQQNDHEQVEIKQEETTSTSASVENNTVSKLQPTNNHNNNQNHHNQNQNQNHHNNHHNNNHQHHINQHNQEDLNKPCNHNINNDEINSIIEFFNVYKKVENIMSHKKLEIENNNSKQDEASQWKSLYSMVNKQLVLERVKIDTLESLITKKDAEIQELTQHNKMLETELNSERKRLNRTVGTIRHGTRKLLSSMNDTVDIASIIDDLNNLESSIPQSLSFVDDGGLTSASNLASIANSTSTSFTDYNSDQLLNRLNSFYQSSGHLRPSASSTSLASNGGVPLTTTPTNRLMALGSDPSVATADELKKITLVQSLVRRWIAKRPFKKLKTKRAVIEELFETESTYVSHLSNLLKIFISPLKNKKGDCIIPTDDYDTIFSTIQLIYKCNVIFLDVLEEIYTKFNKWSCFGEKILEHIPLFECYIDYIINFEYAQKTLKRLLANNSTFANIVKTGQTKKELEDLDLNDLLIMPVQRIPRYIMLLKEIRKFTPLHHLDYHHIDRALDAMKTFADSVNHKSGARQKVLLLEDRILGFKDDITSNSRYLVREGSLKFKKNTEYVFLFSDMLIICHPSHNKKNKRLFNTTSSSSSSSNSSSNSKENSLLDVSMSSNSSTISTSGTNPGTTSPNRELNTTPEVHSNNPDYQFKFMAKYHLDSRVKIIQDPTEPKFTVIISDQFSIEFCATSLEERQLWVQDILVIASIFSNHILNQQTLANIPTTPITTTDDQKQ